MLSAEQTIDEFHNAKAYGPLFIHDPDAKFSPVSEFEEQYDPEEEKIDGHNLSLLLAITNLIRRCSAAGYRYCTPPEMEGKRAKITGLTTRAE